MFDRLFRYEDWANREVVGRLRQIETPQPVALRLLSHIIAAQWLWYVRLTNSGSNAVVWPEMTLDECERDVDQLRAVWADYLADAPLSAAISYTNSKGEAWTSRVEDVLTHLVMHGTYHRGQIAAAVRANDEVPPYTDFIHCTRMGAI